MPMAIWIMDAATLKTMAFKLSIVDCTVLDSWDSMAVQCRGLHRLLPQGL